MSVYIRGMKMPATCIECPLQYGGWCYVAPADLDDTRVAPTVDEAYEQGKPKWCPLTEIPTPHGPLIDQEELFNRFAKLEEAARKKVNSLPLDDIVWYRTWSTILTERTAYKFDVMDAQEIIPAEGELREVDKHDSILTDPRYGPCIDCKMEGE